MTVKRVAIKNGMKDESQWEEEITALLADPQYEGHPLHTALSTVMERQKEQLAHLERLTSLSDGFQSILRARNQTLSERYRKQIRQLEKIVRISDQYQGMLQDLTEKLRLAATLDPLTALANRRLMAERLTAEAVRSERYGSVFSISLIDIDHFKSINDNYGHETGDQALIALSHLLTTTLRSSDVCARWGGEEFLIFFPETTGEQALTITNRLREKIADLHPQGLPEDIRFSASMGVAEFLPQNSIDATIKRADDALYTAKNMGRNRCVLAEDA